MKKLKDFYDALLNENNIVTTLLSKMEQKTGIQKRISAAVILVVIGLYLLFGNLACFLCNLIGFVYPARFSIKAIESTKKDDANQWLTYWALYSILNVFESLMDCSWVTFYYAGKCVFLLWCMAPVSWNGSTVLYKSVIRPVFLLHEGIMGSVVNGLSGKVSDMADTVHNYEAADLTNYDNKVLEG